MRGFWILIVLALLVGGGYALYRWRPGLFRGSSEINKRVSRTRDAAQSTSDRHGGLGGPPIGPGSGGL